MWYAGDDNDTKNKNRQRFRLRIGADITEGPVMLHIRLASGKGEQVSTNQSLTGLSSEKPIFIDRAYVEVTPIQSLDLMGGRMANPFYVGPTGDLVWDDDYNPEGFAERFTMRMGDQGKIYATAGQVVLDGDGTGREAQWFLGYQVGTDLEMDPVGLNLAVLYYHLANGTKGNFSQTAIQDGNTRSAAFLCGATPCALANPFNVVNASAAVTLKAGLPITLSGDYVQNLADTVQLASPDIKDENTGFALGLKVGKASAANTAEVGYAYRSVESDATLADLVDSDWGPNGGTNRKGHIVWTAYSFTKATQFKLKYFNTKMKNEDLLTTAVSGSDPNPTFQRVQLDFSVKF